MFLKQLDLMESTHFNEQLRERTMKVAVDIRNLLKAERFIPIDRPFVNQLIRCSSSVAANYRSATRGRSDAEFYSKICIVLEETDETLFWIDFLIKLDVLNEKEAVKIRSEVEQLVRLFSSIKKKIKEKIERNG
jgi:four helix bundle protein